MLMYFPQPNPQGGSTPPSLPSSVASSDLHRLAGEEAVLDVDVDVLAELGEPAAVANGCQVQQRKQQGGGEGLQAVASSPLALHRLQVGEARAAGQGAAPHQAVAQDGPLEELAAHDTPASQHMKTANCSSCTPGRQVCVRVVTQT